MEDQAAELVFDNEILKEQLTKKYDIIQL